MAKSINLTGTILGVGFNVTVTEGPGETLLVDGQTIDPAGSMPVNLTFEMGEDHFSAGGRLLGNDFQIVGNHLD